MERAFGRVVEAVRRRYDAFTPRPPVAFALRLAGGLPVVIGRGEPSVVLVVNDRRGLSALRSLDSLALGVAYLAGWLDIEGEMQRLLAIRDFFRDRHPLHRLWTLLAPRLTGVVASDRRKIAGHYEADPEFFLLFLDRAYRCYTHGVFADDDEPLEDGIRRKLEYALEAARIRPGDHVLDVGAGWGAFVEFAGRRGIRVTSLTISAASERFVGELIARQGLACRVLCEHLYEHAPAEPYDAIVNMGVTEHLPDYGRTLRAYQRLLKPGGRVYLDACAARVKRDLSSFFRRYIYPGDNSPLYLHDFLARVEASPFELKAVLNDRHHYYLTVRHWARNLEQCRDEIERRWGRAHFRRFQLFLWGSVDGFLRDVLQAYRVVLELR